MTLWVISDTHFSHRNIIEYCGRPFASAEEMDEAMVDRWNAVVKPSDHIYHLGDVAMTKPALAIVKRLNGKKRLVMGNHDIYEAKHYLAAGFQKVMGLRLIGGALMSHIPVHPRSIEKRAAVNIHGHVHQNDVPDDPRYINVCVERTNYGPVALETVMAGRGR